MKLPIQRVQRDPTLQLRDGGLDMERVEDMRHAIADGVALPPITVVGDDNLLADGFHRTYAYEAEGFVDIEATHVEGGRDEAIAIALLANSASLTKPLTRSERNAGIRLLLQADWSQDRIAKETGIARRTIGDIANRLVQRGELMAKPSRDGKSGAKPKAVATLPREVHERLNDTTLYRIAEAPVEQQQELAAAVAVAVTKPDGSTEPLAEPRVREAIKAMKEQGISPAEAVRQYAPQGSPPPVTSYDISKALYRRLKDFLSETVTIKNSQRGPLDFWQLLDFYASQDNSLNSLGAESLASLLEDVAVRSEAAATRLRMSTTGATNGVAVLP